MPDACGTWGYLAGCQTCKAVVLGPGLPKDFHKRPGSIQADRVRAMQVTAERWNRRV